MSDSVVENFHRHLRNLEVTRGRMERLYQGQVILLRDLHSMYESLLISAVTGFESFLDSLFFGILEKKIKYRKRKVALLVKVQSSAGLRNILLGGDKYLAWLPYQKTKERAKLCLGEGYPFTQLDNGKESTLRTILTIRNAIAHVSDHSMSEFRKLINTQPLLKGERKPAAYLRSKLRRGSNEIRFTSYVGLLGQIAVELRKDAEPPPPPPPAPGTVPTGPLIGPSSP
jgi:hypothetical protein